MWCSVICSVTSPIISEVTLIAKLYGRVEMDGYVTEHVAEVIVGLDMLQSHGALWYFQAEKLDIYN